MLWFCQCGDRLYTSGFRASYTSMWWLNRDKQLIKSPACLCCGTIPGIKSQEEIIYTSFTTSVQDGASLVQQLDWFWCTHIVPTSPLFVNHAACWHTTLHRHWYNVVWTVGLHCLTDNKFVIDAHLVCVLFDWEHEHWGSHEGQIVQFACQSSRLLAHAVFTNIPSTHRWWRGGGELHVGQQVLQGF